MRNQRIFELQKSIIYHEKGPKKFYPIMLLPKTSSETILLKNPKNTKNNPET